MRLLDAIAVGSAAAPSAHREGLERRVGGGRPFGTPSMYVMTMPLFLTKQQ
jgi:hypothetical protein